MGPLYDVISCLIFFPACVGWTTCNNYNYDNMVKDYVKKNILIICFYINISSQLNYPPKRSR